MKSAGSIPAPATTNNGGIAQPAEASVYQTQTIVADSEFVLIAKSSPGITLLRC